MWRSLFVRMVCPLTVLTGAIKCVDGGSNYFNMNLGSIA